MTIEPLGEITVSLQEMMDIRFSVEELEERVAALQAKLTEAVSTLEATHALFEMLGEGFGDMSDADTARAWNAVWEKVCVTLNTISSAQDS